jgi:S-adenosylmethionine hydrolase
MTNAHHPAIVTLLTDFGTADGYAAAMKGVILSMAPDATVVDAAHEIPPQDIRAGAWALSTYWRWFPEGAIHIAVVDPGVGTERDALLIVADGHFFLAPDNGLLAMVLKQSAKVQLYRLLPAVHHPRGKSATFHGRDVFAYAAGLLARGKKLDAIAEPTCSIVMPSWAAVRAGPDGLLGEVVHVDRFGNLITNISRRQVIEHAGREAVISCNGSAPMALVETYACGEPGSVIALFGSSDVLEIAVVNGSAAQLTGWGRGAVVKVTGKAQQG